MSGLVRILSNGKQADAGTLETWTTNDSQRRLSEIADQDGFGLVEKVPE